MTACGPKCPPNKPLAPPAAFMQPVPEPVCRLKTNGDLVNCLVETRASLRLANSHTEALRKWAAGEDFETVASPPQ